MTAAIAGRKKRRKVSPVAEIKRAFRSSQKVGQGVLGLFIYNQDGLLYGLLNNEADAFFDAKLLGTTIAQLQSGSREIDCLLCGVGPLGVEDGEAFVVVRPELDAITAAYDSGQADFECVVNCVCRDCARSDDLLTRVSEEYRNSVMPGAKWFDLRASGGRA